MEEAAALEPRRVAIRYFDGCPHWKRAYERVRQVLTESGHGDVTIALEPIASPEDAERLRFVGSPTILLDGEDPFAGDAPGATR